MVKGQATLEFLGGMIIFLITLVASLSIASGNIPDLQDSLEQSEKNTEIYTVTENMLTSPGYHSNNSGGTNWEDNTNYTEELGLASDYLIMQKDKIDALSTTGKDSLNYTQFKNLTEADQQYHFDFIWLPVVETSETFIRTDPPSNPNIIEPDSDLYYSSENRIHYGTFQINGQNFKFLVTAHDGVYDTVRVSRDWNFKAHDPKSTGDNRTMSGTKFTVKQIQNRERKPGTSVILKHPLKSFGPSSEELSQEVTKLNRYAVLKAPNTDKQPVRVEVLAW